MVKFLIYAHFFFIFIAVLVFVFAFFQQCLRQKTLPVKLKKILLHTHFTILLIGFLLIWAKHIDLLAEQHLFLIEKIGAFIAYSAMVFVSLNKNMRKGMQYLAFIGAFGWLAYIMILVTSKQAILL